VDNGVSQPEDDRQQQVDFEAAFTATSEGTEVPTEPTVQDESQKTVAQASAPGETLEQTTGTETGSEEEPHATAEAEADDFSIPLDALDEETMKSLLARSAEVDDLKDAIGKQSQELRRAYGKIGELNAHVKKLMAAPTQQGLNQVELRLSRLEEEYPDIAELLREDLSASLLGAQQQVDGTEPTPPEQMTTTPMTGMPDTTPVPPQEASVFDDAPQVDPTEQLRMEYESKLLAMRHPDWQTIAQSPDFSIWLAGQPQEVQQLARDSWSADAVSIVLDAYKESVQAARERVAERANKRLESAVAPTTTTSATPPAPSEVDDFLSGFKSVMGNRI